MQTKDDAKLSYLRGGDSKDECLESSGQYIHIVCIVKEPFAIEASDEEFVKLAIEGKTFEFLASPEEDIYSADDGNPLQ